MAMVKYLNDLQHQILYFLLLIEIIRFRLLTISYFFLNHIDLTLKLITSLFYYYSDL